MNRTVRAAGPSPWRRRRRTLIEHLLATFTGSVWFAALGLHAQALSTNPLWFARSIVVAGGLCLTTWAWVYAKPPRWPRWRTLAAVAFSSSISGALAEEVDRGSGPITGLIVGVLVLVLCTPGTSGALRTAARACRRWPRR